MFCKCGHPYDAHQHYRAGFDCSRCECLTYLPNWRGFLIVHWNWTAFAWPRNARILRGRLIRRCSTCRVRSPYHKPGCHSEYRTLSPWFRPRGL